MDKRRLTTALGKYLVNPLVRLLAGRRLWPFHALLETRVRRSGRPRRVPVGDGLNGRAFWIVAEHGRHPAPRRRGLRRAAHADAVQSNDLSE